MGCVIISIVLTVWPHTMLECRLAGLLGWLSVSRSGTYRQRHLTLANRSFLSFKR